MKVKKLNNETDFVLYKRGYSTKKKKQEKTSDDTDSQGGDCCGSGEKDSVDHSLDDYLKEMAKKKHSEKTSRNRTINTVYDLARSNTWEHFLTFTFNQNEVDRHDYKAVTKKFKNYLDSMRRRNPEVRYIFVPEPHLDGAIHFHGLVSGLGDERKIRATSPSGIPLSTPSGLPIYNILNYRLGWSTLTEIKDSLRSSNYLTKYLTKDIIGFSTDNKRRYWASKNLSKPEVEKLNITKEQLICFKRFLTAKNSYSSEVEVSHNGFVNSINYFTI